MDQPDQVIWGIVKEQAQIGVHAPSGVVLAQMVYDGRPYTGAGATSNAALRDLCTRIEADIEAGPFFHAPGPNGERYAR